MKHKKVLEYSKCKKHPLIEYSKCKKHPLIKYTFTNTENLAHFWGFLDNFSDVVTAVGCEEVCDEDTQESSWTLYVQAQKNANDLDIAIINDAFEDITVRQVEI